MDIKKVLLSKPVIVVGTAAVGALVTWVLINWLPTLVILSGTVVAGYVAHLKTK